MVTLGGQLCILVEERGAILVPGFVREVGADSTLMQPDGLHPTAEGHRQLAEILVPYLERAVADVQTKP